MIGKQLHDKAVHHQIQSSKMQITQGHHSQNVRSTTDVHRDKNGKQCRRHNNCTATTLQKGFAICQRFVHSDLRR